MTADERERLRALEVAFQALREDVRDNEEKSDDRHQQNIESLTSIKIALGIREGIDIRTSAQSAGVAARREGRWLAVIGAAAVIISGIISSAATVMAEKVFR